jgi:hypothetical protein
VTELFGFTQLIDGPAVLQLAGRLAINLLFAGIVVRLIYFRLYKNREYAFTYYLFNVITFLLCLLLRKVPIELGFALGLFAVFGILRYRTEPIKIRDLTYLFIMIGLGILNAVANSSISLAEVLSVNAAIVGLAALLELSPSNRSVRSTPMVYDNLDLLKPGSESDLYCDLITRTGFRIERVEVQRIDLLRDSAEITIFYIDQEN